MARVGRGETQLHCPVPLWNGEDGSCAPSRLPASVPGCKPCALLRVRVKVPRNQLRPCVVISEGPKAGGCRGGLRASSGCPRTSSGRARRAGAVCAAAGHVPAAAPPLAGRSGAGLCRPSPLAAPAGAAVSAAAIGGGAAWRARAAPGGRRGRVRTTGESGSIAAGCAMPSTTTTRTGSCRPATAGGMTTRPAAPGRGTAPPPRRKPCARVKELELWKNRNMLQCGSSGRAHHLTGICHLIMTNQINKTLFCAWSVT